MLPPRPGCNEGHLPLKQDMALRHIILIVVWERISASIIAAGKPLPQGKTNFTGRTQPLNREPLNLINNHFS